MAHDPDLADRVRDILGPRQGITEKKMFGGLAFLLRGNMLLAVSDRGLMARVGPAGFEEALARDHVRPMDFTGRPMKGYVYVDPTGLESEDDLAYWVERCAAFVGSLPPKAAK